jgi:hypothetical protein
MVAFGEQVQHITFEEEDNTMILLTKQEIRYIVNAQEVFVFDAEGLLGFFFLKKENERDIVIDHFKTKGRIPQVKLVNFITDNNHIKEVHSYGIINAVYPYCVSYLEKDQHMLEDFSENTTRLICQRYVREHNNNQKIELTWESRKIVYKYSIILEDAPPIFKDPASYTGRRQHEEDFIDLLEKKGIK